MRYWIQFMHADLSGKLADALGSDSVCFVDGRLSQYNMERKAEERADALRYVKPHYTYFRLVKGTSIARERRSTAPIKLNIEKANVSG